MNEEDKVFSYPLALAIDFDFAFIKNVGDSKEFFFCRILHSHTHSYRNNKKRTNKDVNILFDFFFYGFDLSYPKSK